jgi:hypothetical protein
VLLKAKIMIYRGSMPHGVDDEARTVDLLPIHRCAPREEYVPRQELLGCWARRIENGQRGSVTDAMNNATGESSRSCHNSPAVQSPQMQNGNELRLERCPNTQWLKRRLNGDEPSDAYQTGY